MIDHTAPGRDPDDGAGGPKGEAVGDGFNSPISTPFSESKLPDGTIADTALLNRAFLHMAAMAAAFQGERAFDSPKTSAAWHEAGHAVIAATQGICPVEVWIRPVSVCGRTHWEGRTEGTPLWHVDANTDVEDDRAQAVFEIAGWTAEIIFDGANFRAGSSLDEVITAQSITLTVAIKTQREPKQLWAEILVDTAESLRAQEPIVRAIADELRRKRRVGARRLRAHLRPVLQSSGGGDGR
jgi:hypothetical protein